MTNEERLARIEGLLFEIALKLNAGTDERNKENGAFYPFRSFNDKESNNLKLVR